MWKKITKFLKNVKKLSKSNFRIEEIDLSSKKVVISRRGMQTILKISVIDAVNDKSLISNLSSDQACWLGYYCGKMFRDIVLENRSLCSLDHQDHFELSAKKNKYRIVSQDRRGNILYYDYVNKISYTESPLTLISNRKLINEFDPTQACYIGILAGLLTPKQIKVLSPKSNVIKPFLRLVE